MSKNSLWEGLQGISKEEADKTIDSLLSVDGSVDASLVGMEGDLLDTVVANDELTGLSHLIQRGIQEFLPAIQERLSIIMEARGYDEERREELLAAVCGHMAVGFIAYHAKKDDFLNIIGPE